MSSSQVTSQSEEKETELVITNVSSDVQDKISSDNTTVTKVTSSSQGILVYICYHILYVFTIIFNLAVRGRIARVL